MRKSTDMTHSCSGVNSSVYFLKRKKTVAGREGTASKHRQVLRAMVRSLFHGDCFLRTEPCHASDSSLGDEAGFTVTGQSSPFQREDDRGGLNLANDLRRQTLFTVSFKTQARSQQGIPEKPQASVLISKMAPRSAPLDQLGTVSKKNKESPPCAKFSTVNTYYFCNEKNNLKKEKY